MYVGLSVHAKTRRKDLADTLFQLGLSISYDRVMDMTTALGNHMSGLYHREQVVCPTTLREGLFTTAAVDNINHNPSCTSSTGSFHGTGISLFQHLISQNKGIYCGVGCDLDSSPLSRRISNLPTSFTTIQPTYLRNKETTIPRTIGPVQGNWSAFIDAMREEKRGNILSSLYNTYSE